ncbi:uncharacterized protein LOC125374061 [Haliotis rufescens]|uniref:uncharacterized protein LOC125374061 n=1 Tax=Haliotis rufescens TaxID=6454 RepID=UPI00201EAAF3|nr:uncharacterized protein LOC125374061 [Haliotis rufescens]
MLSLTTASLLAPLANTEEVFKRQYFKMESPRRRKLLLYDEEIDITYFEMKAWKAVVHTVVAASQLYADKIDQGREILNFFCKLGIQHGKKRYYSQPRAERFNQCLTKISDFHKAVLGDMVKHTGPDGPFGDLLMSDNHVFEQLLRRAAAMKKTHLKLEKKAAKAWKYYGRRVRKKEDLYTKLSGTMTDEDIELDRKYTSFKSKTDAALTRYNIFFADEVNEREGLAQKTESLKEDFLEQEKEKLDAMFSSICNLVERMEKLAPASLGCLDYEPEDADTTAMAREMWESSLKKHTFPKHQASDYPTTEDVDEATEDADSDDEDKESVDDEDSDEESDNTSLQSRKKEITVGSLAAPKNDPHLAEVLEEILMSDNDEPAQEKSHTPDRASTPTTGADVILPESPRWNRGVDNLIRQRSTNTFQSARHGHKSAPIRKDTKVQDLKVGSDYQPPSPIEQECLQKSSLQKELSAEHVQPQHTVHTKAQPGQPNLASGARRRRRAAKVVQSHSPGCDSSSSTALGHSNKQKSPIVKESSANRLDRPKEGCTSNSSGTGPQPSVSTMSRVSVFAVQNWKKTSPNQISLRVGMKIKQTRAAGADGMAYGYKKNKLGVRIHGSYPAGLVSLCVPATASHPNQ